ncbi:phospholipase [Rubrivivax gelatinosus]|uniref:patatin-like phospholipase family protein n=1 Tax=Rubrivivax gelatinosus TaxID=28068 RepID=UPI00190560E5|nr:phospholipase [Rubrivivax gelatinosus]MBK1612049.1 phospholipase [Rubrivivax gelatinosus]
MRALQLFAGPRARCVLQERGLRAADVRVLPGAAGGPKGLVLNPLDRFIFGHWLRDTGVTVHLLGASIGAWRLASACLPDADAALATLAEDYITQHYEHEPGRPPTKRQISETFSQTVNARLGVCADRVLSHPRFRLHVFTSRGRHLLGREGRWRTPIGYAGAFVVNAASRRALGGWIERVVFSDPRDALPFALSDYPSRVAPLSAANLASAVLASCSIPFWLDAVHDVPGGPRGAYWDGGITDYHLHLGYATMTEGLVLYPHFQPQIVPGWLDKAWTRRHRATPLLDNVVVLAPTPEWVRSLPNGKLPDRQDFKAYGDDLAGRVRVWRRALDESRRLADDFAELVSSGRPLDPLPLR